MLGRARIDVTCQFPIKRLTETDLSLNICPVSNTISCYGEIIKYSWAWVAQPGVGGTQNVSTQDKQRTFQHQHDANCPSSDPDEAFSTDSSLGAPGSVGGNSPLSGYWTGPSPQGLGKKR